jgi:D-cysteine desulfhydrase
MSLAELPTPVSQGQITCGDRLLDVLIKHDDVSGAVYGGNKLRKLEYILQQAQDKQAKRIATFGGVGSNHAVATALYARRTGFECSCFLFHQSLKPGLGNALRFHMQNGTEIIAIGGDRHQRVATMRKYAQGRRTWVVPLGGSSWQGTVGYVNAALELAAQIESGELACPARVYVALGTMGTAAGLALGFALAGLDTELHAIRVTQEQYSNKAAVQRLMHKTACMMRRLDPSIPADLAERARWVHRSEFFAGGYGRTNAATEEAIRLGQLDLGLSLESTYSGKTLCGLLHDYAAGAPGDALFWNTYNSRPMNIDTNLPADFARVPREFARYFD